MICVFSFVFLSVLNEIRSLRECIRFGYYLILEEKKSKNRLFSDFTRNLKQNNNLRRKIKTEKCNDDDDDDID